MPTLFMGEEHWEGVCRRDGHEHRVPARLPCQGMSGRRRWHRAWPRCGTAHNEGRTHAGSSDPEVTPVAEGVTVYLFWGNTCPTCSQRDPCRRCRGSQIGEDPGPAAYAFLDRLADEIPGLTIQAYDVWTSDVDRATFERVAAAYDAPARGTDDLHRQRAWEGFDAATAAEIRATAERRAARQGALTR